MVTKSGDKISEVRSNLFGAKGDITFTHLRNTPADLYDKGRLFAHLTLAPGDAIGFHVHNGESETYYVLSGEAEYNDNGTIVPLAPGDVTHTPPGEGHGLRNSGSVPLEVIALILYA